jgi:uracil-DNA glycosylase family 4
MSSHKTDLLREIKEEVIHLTASPLYAYRTENGYYPVIGQGNHDAKIMFIGEAPGENEAKTGRPFCGASGRLLDELLASVNINREDVYITNIVKDRPPKNRDPQRGELSLYAPFLDRQINIIQPQVIATLGRFSMEFVLTRFNAPESKQKISALHGKLIQVKADYGDIHVLPLFHPAAALYNGSQKPILMEDFQMLKDFA